MEKTDRIVVENILTKYTYFWEIAAAVEVSNTLVKNYSVVFIFIRKQNSSRESFDHII